MEPGVVVFSTDTRPAKRRKSQIERQPRDPNGSATKKEMPVAKAARALAVRRLGETARPAVSMPASTRGDLFGAVDGSTFEGLGLDTSLAQHLEAINFTAPTRIQQAVLPVMLARRDVLASASTGSGKTLAYVAPIVNVIQAQTLPHSYCPALIA